MLRINPNENILAVYRRHWLILFGDIAIISFLGLILLIISLVLKRFLPGIYLEPLRPLTFWIIFTFYQALWIALFIKLADYWLDAWILTNERIIDIEQRGLFRREISEFKLDKIQDVSTDVKGVIQTLFGYGDVQVETAGFERRFVFKTVHDPHLIKNQVLRAHDEYMELKRVTSESNSTGNKED